MMSRDRIESGNLRISGRRTPSRSICMVDGELANSKMNNKHYQRRGKGKIMFSIP